MSEPLYTIPDFLCQQPPAVDTCSLLLPGGFTLESVNLLDMAQPALAPLASIFSIVEAVVAVKNCLDAVTEMPDPAPLLECLPALAAKIAALLKLLPQFSVPVMVITLINCIIAELIRLRAFIVGLLSQVQRIAAIVALASELEDANLNAIAVCANNRLAGLLDEKMQGLIVLGRLLGALGELLGLINVPDDLIPNFADISGAELNVVLEPIDAAIDLLGQLKVVIEPIARAVQ